MLEICRHFLSLQDDRAKLFGIFVEPVEDDEDEDLPPSAYSAYSAARGGHDDDEPGPPSDEPPPPPLPMRQVGEMPPRTGRPLRSRDYLGDIVVQLTRAKTPFTFVFKRKIFLGGKGDAVSSDPVYSRLMYLQCADEIISGNLPVSKENEIVTLTAMAMAADNEQMGSTEDALLEQSLPDYIPSAWRTKKTDRQWAKTILAARGKVAKKSLEDIQQQYIAMCAKMPLYGHCFFFVREDMDGNDEIASVNHEGIHLLSLSRVVMSTYTYSALHRWGGSSTSFWVLVYDQASGKKKKLTFFTSQARDISSLILDFAVLSADKAK